MAVAVIMMIRLDKFLADMGYGTRSQVKKELAKGSVTVNGSPVRKPETKLDTEKDAVCWKGEPAVYARYEYFMLNKPSGVVSATEDKKEKTVLDLLRSVKAVTKAQACSGKTFFLWGGWTKIPRGSFSSQMTEN